LPILASSVHGQLESREDPGLRRRLVLCGLILIPAGAALLALGLRAAGIVVFASGWALGLLPILLVPVAWARSRRADAPYRRMPVPTFILATALGGITVGMASPAAGVALCYLALVWLYIRWVLS
jgi:hypothetical protein